MGDIAARSDWSELLWRSWGSLGVASWTRTDIQTVVDPEALIVATTLVGDDRLVLETIDWGILHVALLNVSRLRSIAREAGADEQAEAWLAAVAAHARTSWSPRIANGFPGFTPSRKSGPIPTAGPATVALRLRAVTGASTRAEVIRALHPTALGVEGGQSTRELARRVGASVAQVRSALDELVGVGLIRRDGSERRRVYTVPVRSRDAALAGLWLPWRTIAWGPWRDLALVASALRTIDVATRRSGPEAVVVALDARERVLKAIERTLPELAVPSPTGGVDEVRHMLGGWSREVATRYIEQLSVGVWGSAPNDVGVPRTGGSPSQNPWGDGAAWITRASTDRN